MRIKAKNWNDNSVLHIFIFLKIIIITISISLIIFQTSILIQAMLIRSILLSLHRHNCFNKLLSWIIFIYLFSRNWFIGSDDNLGSGKNKNEDLSTAAAVISGIFGAIIFIGVGMRVVEEFCPEAIPAIQKAVFAVATAIIATVQSTFEKSQLEFSVGASESTEAADTETSEAADKETSEAADKETSEAADKETSKAVRDFEIMRSSKALFNATRVVGVTLEDQKGLFRAGRDALKARKIAIDHNVDPHFYHEIVISLFSNNVPASKCIKDTSFFAVLKKIQDRPAGSSPLYERPLTKKDRIFYRILDEAMKELKKK